MKSQPNKQTRNYKNYNSYTAPFPKYEFQIDLMVMSSLLNDVGVDVKNQPKFGFVCIDVFSKKCHIVPMEINDIDTFFNAMLECFKVLGYPLSIYSDDEGALNSKKIQNYLKGEGIELIITKTHASQAERMIRTIKKMISDRLRHHKGSWVEMMKVSLKKYNSSQIHSSTQTTPNKAHDLDNVLDVRANQILKEKHNRKYPNVTEGDSVKVYSKGKGNYTSRKESRSVWSERKYKVILVHRFLHGSPQIQPPKSPYLYKRKIVGGVRGTLQDSDCQTCAQCCRRSLVLGLGFKPSFLQICIFCAY